MKLALKWKTGVSYIKHLQWNPKGGILAVVYRPLEMSKDKNGKDLLVFFHASGVSLWRLKSTSFDALAFSPDGSLIAVAAYNYEKSTVTIRDSEGREKKLRDYEEEEYKLEVYTITEKSLQRKNTFKIASNIRSIALSSDYTMAIVTEDNVVSFWNIKKNFAEELWRWRVDTQASITNQGTPLVRFNPVNANLVAVSTSNGEIIFVDLNSRTIHRHASATKFVEWSPEGKLLLVGGNGILRVYDDQARLLDSVPADGESATWISNDTILVAGSTISTYSIKEGKLKPLDQELDTLKCECFDGIMHMSYSAPDNMLALVFKLGNVSRLCTYNIII